MTVRVIGISSRTGDLHELLPMASKGKFQLHEGATSEDRKRNPPLLRDSIEEAIQLIREGKHPRMKNITQKHGRPNRTQAPDIMAPENLIVLRYNGIRWIQEAI